MKYHSPDPIYNSEYILYTPQDNITLVFNSKFESANLHKAVKITDYEYMLYVHSDTNTSDQNHWYYFSVVNPRKTSINFKIANMLKKDILYLSGMKPCVWSKQQFERDGIKWHRDGYNITYTENKDDVKGLKFIGSKRYYTLSFTYDFKYDDDLIYFAYAVPYTYSELTTYLADLKNRYANILRVNQLCKTLSGNVCEMVTITESIADYFPFEDESQEWHVSSNSRKLSKIKTIKKEQQEKYLGSYKANKHEKKKGIVLTARVHSGETVSSFMIRGAIDFLVSNFHSARLLRKNFVFKIVPMLNIDGCKYGNYRCSLLGVDLNRRWTYPSKALHPTIYFAKKMIETFKEKHEVMMVCDMHGHTKKKNVFMYGCGVKSTDPIDSRKNLLARVVPYLMSLRNKFFSYKDSHFRMESDRKATARVVLWESFEIAHSYTMEASFFGPSKATAFPNQLSNDMHMNEKHLESLGVDLAKICLIFSNKTLYMRKTRMTNDYLRHIWMAKGFQLSKPLVAKAPTLPATAKVQTKEDANYDAREGIISKTSSNFYQEIVSKTKNMNKSNKLSENLELKQIEEEVELEDDLSETEVFTDELLWDQIDVVHVSPDSDSGGSDSDCSVEYKKGSEPQRTYEKVVEEARYKQTYEKKTEFPPISTPQPIAFKNKAKVKQAPIEKLIVGKHISSYPTPKTISPKKILESLQLETPIIPQVFIFPDEKNQIDKVSDSFGSFQRCKEPLHIKDSHISKDAHKALLQKKDSKSLYGNMNKKSYKLRSKIATLSSCEQYTGYLDNKRQMMNEEILRSSLEKKGKVFSKIRTHKQLNDLFESRQHRCISHSVALSSRYKIEKIFSGK